MWKVYKSTSNLSSSKVKRNSYLLKIVHDKYSRCVFLKLKTKVKAASTLFEKLFALLIKNVDENDDNNNGDYHISFHRLVTIINRASLFWS